MSGLNLSLQHNLYIVVQTGSKKQFVWKNITKCIVMYNYSFCLIVVSES